MNRLSKADADTENRTNRRLGHRIGLVRSASGVSLRDAAERVGISFTLMQRYESGEVAVTIGRLVRICHALEIPPASVLEGVLEPSVEHAEEDMGIQFARILGRLPHAKRVVVLALVREMAR